MPAYAGPPHPTPACPAASFTDHSEPMSTHWCHLPHSPLAPLAGCRYAQAAAAACPGCCQQRWMALPSPPGAQGLPPLAPGLPPTLLRWGQLPLPAPALARRRKPPSRWQRCPRLLAPRALELLLQGLPPPLLTAAAAHQWGMHRQTLPSPPLLRARLRAAGLLARGCRSLLLLLLLQGVPLRLPLPWAMRRQRGPKRLRVLAGRQVALTWRTWGRRRQAGSAPALLLPGSRCCWRLQAWWRCAQAWLPCTAQGGIVGRGATRRKWRLALHNGQAAAPVQSCPARASLLGCTSHSCG